MMAKITARGAREVARKLVYSAAGAEYLYVLASDGRVLTRRTGQDGTAYTVRTKIRPRPGAAAADLAYVYARDGMSAEPPAGRQPHRPGRYEPCPGSGQAAVDLAQYPSRPDGLGWTQAATHGRCPACLYTVSTKGLAARLDVPRHKARVAEEAQQP